ncbi:MAG: hypothetical protein ABI068_16970 [Ktedonobacterales bacterium]
MSDPYAEKLQRLQAALLLGRGALDPAVREALSTADAVPEPLASYAAKVTRHAYRVTDEDMQALRAAGYTEDQIFEATLSVAFGAARLRLEAGLRALGIPESREG